MGAIIIQTNNPLDLPPDELRPLADNIQAAYPDTPLEVTAREMRRGAYQVTLYEVITVWVPTAYTYGQVVYSFVG